MQEHARSWKSLHQNSKTRRRQSHSVKKYTSTNFVQCLNNITIMLAYNYWYGLLYSSGFSIYPRWRKTSQEWKHLKWCTKNGFIRRKVRKRNLIVKSNPWLVLTSISYFSFTSSHSLIQLLLFIINRESHERELLELAEAIEQKVQILQEQMVEVSRGRHLCETHDTKQMAAP